VPAYELQALLSLRRSVEREAEAALHRALSALAEVKARQVDLEQAAEAAGGRARQEHETRLRVAPRDAAEAMAVDRFLARLDAAAVAARADAAAHRSGPLTEAEAQVNKARDSHLEARRDHEAIDKHRQRHEEEQRKERERREELAADELAATTRRR
jgi:flagellar biosynthesis chaperone FliJ